MVLILLLATLVVIIPSGVCANGGNKAADLHVEAFYNYTKVISGEPSWFNLTVHNGGDAAYLVRSHGSLEVYAYRDDEAQVATFERVYEDIYVNQTLVIDFKVQFDTLGQHSLTVIIDGADRVKESNEENNDAMCSFTVVSAESNRPPEADGGNDRTGYAGKALLFSAKYSFDPDHDQLTYTWDYGDGAIGSGERTHHTYDELGDYAVELTVSDGIHSDKDSFTVHIIETPTNRAPNAVIIASSKNVLVNEEVILDGSSSQDLDGDDLSYEWTIEAANGGSDRVRGDLIVQSWNLAGHYTVTLVVSDGTDEGTVGVTIEVGAPPPPNEPPVANAGVDLIVEKGSEWTLRGVGYDSDGVIISYEWDLDGDGVYDTFDESDGSVSHKFEDSGYVTVRLRVTDDKGGTQVDSMVVTVKNKKTDDKATPDLPGFMIILIILGAAIITRMNKIRGSWQRFQR